jgi:hypothetical protein
MMSDVAVEISMFERIGGALTIDRLVESFYQRMDALPEAEGIRAMHAVDLGPPRLFSNAIFANGWEVRSSTPLKKVIHGCASGIWASKSASVNAMRGFFV